MGRKRKCYYHATYVENIDGILNQGLKPGIDGVVYLAETEYDALKFMAVRAWGRPLVVFPVFASGLNKKRLLESFDHSFAFFNCRAWMYMDQIPAEALGDMLMFDAKG